MSTRFQNWLLFTIGTCALYLAGIFFPALVAPVTLIFSLPTAFLAFEYGSVFAMSSAVFSSLVIGVALSGSAGLLYFLSFGMPGTLMGLIAKNKPGNGNLLVASATVEFFGKLGGILLFHLFYGVNLLSPPSGTEEFKKSLMVFGASYLTADTVNMIIDRVILLIPYMLILFSVLEALFCLVLLSYIHKRRTGEAVFSLPPFKSWKFPRSVLLALVVGFICEQISSVVSGNAYLLKQMGANLSELSRTIFVLQGLSCAYFFMEHRGIPKPMRIITVVMTPLISFLGDIFAIVGVADIGFNFRDRKKGKLKE